jgi:hypothetical protein
MSARKIGNSDVFPPLTLHSRNSRLGIPASAVRVHKNGIEFHGASAIPVWTEMTVDVQIPRDRQMVNFTGVVVACTGNRHAGYNVAMVFTNVTPKAQARLNALAYSP